MTDIRTRRPTKQRIAIEADLEEFEEFRTAQEIHASLHAAGDKIGLATVYRTLQTMVEEDIVDQLRTDEGEQIFRRCSTGHHHHLVCRDCGRTVEVEGPTVERWADRVAIEHGFTQVAHTLELFGRCGRCAGE
ncbi:Fur family transcriptional regulator [Janibacter cremeus]|uniref:Fur family ferric uptake transcriptional regulator n=1 Tax=Janibacter cremeus TaxID=1285192 RepID=A0A852VQX4_9MICO|nr:transcriptional repressor [Janibacter cremeus]NYF99427.1 Fur family ferric uptake transcriptional regulator [Janibacter cremeus]